MLFFISFTHFFGDHSFQQQTEISPVDPAVFGTPIRQAEGALLQTLIPDGQSIAVPIEQFDPVAVSVTKDKQGTGERVLIEFHPDQAAQAVEGFSQVTSGPVQIDPGGGGQGQHDPLTPQQGYNLAESGRIETEIQFN